MTMRERRLELLHQGEVVSVVKDEKPVRLCGKPMHDSLDNLRQILFVVLRKLQRLGNGNISCNQFLSRRSTHPEHGLIVLSMLIGILDGDLGLANATQSADGLWLGKGRRLP